MLRNIDDLNGRCPTCNSILVEDQSKGECFCSSCGYVVYDHTPTLATESIDSSLESRFKSTRGSGSTSYSYHDLGISSDIYHANRDFNGKSIRSDMLDEINRIRRWHSRLRVSSSKERRIYNVLTKINEICSILSLPRVINESASLVYRMIESKSKAKGRSSVCMACACIYHVCKQYSILRSIDEIAEAAGCKNKRLIYKYYRIIALESIVDDESRDSIDNNGSSNSSSKGLFIIPIDMYIAKLSNTIRLDTKVEKLAIDIARKTVDRSAMDGKAPYGLAAAYIYMACVLLGMKVLQSDISSASNVTEVTVRNRYRELINNYRIRIVMKAVDTIDDGDTS